MKVWVLYTGEYSDRFIHSIHSTEAKAQAIAKLVSGPKEAEWDINEYEVNELLCSICGYPEDIHKYGLDPGRHPFTSDAGAKPA